MAETGPNLAEQPELTKRGRLRLEEVAFLALVGLSIIGESVTNYSPIISFWYWLTMIPVFAMTAIITEWSQARARGISATNVILIQIDLAGLELQCHPEHPKFIGNRGFFKSKYLAEL